MKKERNRTLTLPQLKLPFAYCDTPEMRVLDLTAEGMPNIRG